MGWPPHPGTQQRPGTEGLASKLCPLTLRSQATVTRPSQGGPVAAPCPTPWPLSRAACRWLPGSRPRFSGRRGRWQWRLWLFTLPRAQVFDVRPSPHGRRCAHPGPWWRRAVWPALATGRRGCGFRTCAFRIRKAFCSSSRACAITVLCHMSQPGPWSAEEQTHTQVVAWGQPPSRLTLPAVDICRCLLCSRS